MPVSLFVGVGVGVGVDGYQVHDVCSGFTQRVALLAEAEAERERERERGREREFSL
jgi:hypothetical protein